jgi:hypothetical protein
MFSRKIAVVAAGLAVAAAAILGLDAGVIARSASQSAAESAAQSGRTTPTFYADDPILVDDDRAFDASGAKSLELSEIFDYVHNTWGSPGNRSSIRALNVNTLDEVPDSSWFTNRIGVRDMPIA